MNLIDIRQVLTQILGFLLLVWILRRVAWGPLLALLEARRGKIAESFAAAERQKQEALELRQRYEQELRTIDAQARQKLQETVAEAQRVAGEIKNQAQREATDRVQRAEDEIAREREKAKELLKGQIIHLAMRSAEKILRKEIDDASQRKLVGEFVDEVGALK